MSNPKLFVEQINTSETLSGLDFGDKTIGIAISDKTHTIATPIMTLKRKGIKKDIIEITNNSLEAYEKAKKILKRDEIIIAFGSLYIAAEIIELVKNINPEKYNYE